MYTVMLVDDEPWVIIDILHTISWEKCGFRVIGHFEKAREALDAIITQKPDLVFTDIRMPIYNGFELIDAARKAGSRSEFILLSSYSDFTFAQKAIRLQVADYCLKPVNPQDFTALLNTVKKRLDERLPVKQPAEAPLPYAEEQFESIVSYLREYSHCKLSLEQIANKFSFNKNYICHLFKKYRKTTFSAFLNALRIDEAKQLLRSTNLTLIEIADKTGFSDVYYFCKVFKAVSGDTPNNFRKKPDGIV